MEPILKKSPLEFSFVIIGCLLSLLIILSILPPILHSHPHSHPYGSAEWFFDNFTPEQRLHVRKAIDYAIPRDQIIEEVLDGLGTKIASPIEANDGAYDPTFTAREYNLSKALDHLESAFGYRYNDISENETDRIKYFRMVIMAPTSLDERMEWAAITTKNLVEIGIDVTLKYVNWNIANPSVFGRPNEGTQGFNYAHGGYDGFFMGWEGSPESDVRQWFGKENWAPDGNNLGFIDNSEVDEILDRALESPDLSDRLAAFKEFQVWFKEHLPYFIVLQSNDLWAKDPGLEGVSFNFDYPNYQNWTHTDSEITVMTPRDFENLNPLLSGSYYDKLAVSDIFEGLIGRFGDDPNTYYGQIAESWNASFDKLTWTFTMRDDLKWSDGSDLTVDDIVYTYQSYLNPETNCYGATNMVTFINASNVIKVDTNRIQFVLNKFNVYSDNFFTLPILQEAQMSLIPPTQWITDVATNTEFAPIGTGPYMMDESNTNIAEGSVTLITNQNYTNTRGHDDWNNPDRIETIKVELFTSTATAVTALKSGALNIIDSNVALQPYVNEINTSGVTEGWGEIHQTPSWGHQGFYINQVDPIWGINPMDPTDMYLKDYGPEYPPYPDDIRGAFFGFIMVELILYGLIQFRRDRRKKI